MISNHWGPGESCHETTVPVSVAVAVPVSLQLLKGRERVHGRCQSDAVSQSIGCLVRGLGAATWLFRTPILCSVVDRSSRLSTRLAQLNLILNDGVAPWPCDPGDGATSGCLLESRSRSFLETPVPLVAVRTNTWRMRILDFLRCETWSLYAAQQSHSPLETRGGIAELKLLPRCRSRRLIVLTRQAGLASVSSRGPAVRGQSSCSGQHAEQGAVASSV